MFNIRLEHIIGLVEAHKVLVGWLAGLSLLAFVGTLIAVPLVIVWLPKDYLHKEDKIVEHWPAYLSAPFLIFKNGLGVLFIVSGLAMLILPGQGLLTLFTGLVLLNFPRKKILIRRVLSNDFIFRMINRLRHRFGRPELELP